MKTLMLHALVYSTIILYCSSSLQSQNRKPEQILTNGHYVEFKPNNNAIWFSNNGAVSHNNITDAAGWEYPKGSGKFVGFETGVVWGGMVAGQLRVGGSAYRHALQAGTLDTAGNPSNPADPKYHVYYIRKEDAATGTNPDYNNWPLQDGAPADQNGKPLFYGDEQLWFVSNDKDSASTAFLYGTPPIGLEVQTTVWGFSNNEYLKDVVFVKHLLINKSGFALTNAYIGLWNDFDLGDANDDFTGVDTSIQLSYIYNGEKKDRIYDIPPAAGLQFLQTPIIPSSNDTIVFQGNRRAGFKYCPVSGFCFYFNASGVYADPTQGHVIGASELYENLQGLLFNSIPCTDPTTGNPTKFCFNGDPLINLGWIDGRPAPPGDRRSLMSAGPFTIADKDTQEIVYAMLVKQGRDRIESLFLLKEYANAIKLFYGRGQISSASHPVFNVEASYPDINSVSLKFSAVDSNAIDGKVVLMHLDKSVVAEIPLFDDGAHNDGAVNDHHFASAWSASSQKEAVDVYADMTYPDGVKYRWLVKRCVPLCGLVKLTGVHIESDHINEDGKANPGENIRISLDVKNETPYTLGDVHCTELDGMAPTNDIYRILSPFISGTTERRNYSDTQPGKYVTVDIPANAQAGDEFAARFLIQDSFNNCWYDSVLIDVYELPVPPMDSLAIHIAGNCTGSLGYRIIDPAQWKDRMYRITLDNNWVTPRIFVYDCDTKQYRGGDIRIPDIYAHDFPIIDGFRMTIGTCIRTRVASDYPFLVLVAEVKHEYIPPQNDWLNPVDGIYDWIAGQDFFGSALLAIDLVPVKLVFSSTQTQKGYDYLRGTTPNYGFTSLGTIPFRAYDISDSLHPRQINVAFVEQKGAVSQDSQWMPTMSSSDREYLFILKSSYTGMTDSFYTSKKIYADASNIDIMYAGWFTRKTVSSTFLEGDEIRIIPTVPVSYKDTFIVNIKGRSTGIRNKSIPSLLSLSQNYPNPVSLSDINSSATIEYGIPSQTHVQIKLFDILGREITTLVDEENEAGFHTSHLDLRTSNLANRPGVYFYRLIADKTIITQKMIVTR